MCHHRLSLAALAVAVLLSSHAVIAQQPAAARPAVKQQSPDAVQGMSRARMARIAPAMKEQTEKGMFPGAVTLVARRGQVVHFEAHGHQDAARSNPMRRESLFMLASMTKPIVTAAAMMLVEQGRMKLNDPIVNWLPELKDLKVETPAGDVPPTRPIWVQDLMRHTAGFVYGGGTKSERIKKMYEEGNIEARETDITGDEMLKNLGKIPLAHQPGTVWEYSIATDVLGLLIERVAKQPLDVLLKEMLIDPLGMKDTAFWVPPEKISRLAETLDSDPLKATLMKSYRVFSNPAGKSYFKGGAGLVGTAEDYLRFCQMLVNGGEYQGKRYLAKKTVEFMLSNHTVGIAGSPFPTTGPGYAMGLGFGVRLDEGMGWAPGTKGDAMWAGIWGTSFWIDPKEQLVGILMAQGPSSRIHTRMLYKNLVYGAMVK
jgi:CubicO group peptidase (beta-lactamase class C family)